MIDVIWNIFWNIIKKFGIILIILYFLSHQIELCIFKIAKTTTLKEFPQDPICLCKPKIRIVQENIFFHLHYFFHCKKNNVVQDYIS